MKVRDSGMPQKDYWNSFFDSKKLIDKLFYNKIIDENITEFGCGYGTFTIPASFYTTKNIYALDIEDDLIKELRSEAINLNIKNIICKKIDLSIKTDCSYEPEIAFNFFCSFSVNHSA